MAYNFLSTWQPITKKQLIWRNIFIEQYQNRKSENKTILPLLSQLSCDMVSDTLHLFPWFCFINGDILVALVIVKFMKVLAWSTRSQLLLVWSDTHSYIRLLSEFSHLITTLVFIVLVTFLFIKCVFSPIGCGCRICQLHLCKGVGFTPNKYPGYDIKSSDGEAPVLELS